MKSLIFKAVSCAALVVAAMTANPVLAKSQASIERLEDKLTAAGFEAKPANTDERRDMLSRLPANKFVQRVNGDMVAYVYADSKNCSCLYVGTEAAYGAYRRQEQAQQLADQQRATAELYDDARWDWGAWGHGDLAGLVSVSVMAGEMR